MRGFLSAFAECKRGLIRFRSAWRRVLPLRRKMQAWLKSMPLYKLSALAPVQKNPIEPERMTLHVVLDTNVLLSGLAYPASIPGSVVAA